MIPFHAFYLPMPQYQLPWMTIMDLMLHSIPNKASMLPWREGFFGSKALVQFLNVLDTDEWASEQLRVILWPIAIEIVTDEVDTEMEAARIFLACRRKMSPPNYSHLILMLCWRRAPWLRRILLSAIADSTYSCQTEYHDQSRSKEWNPVLLKLLNLWFTRTNLTFLRW